MELMIPFPLILPDEPLPFDRLEAATHAWGLAIQQAAPPRRGRSRRGREPVDEGAARDALVAGTGSGRGHLAARHAQRRVGHRLPAALVA